MDWQEDREIQQEGEQSPAHEEEEPQAQIHAGGRLSGKQFGRKGLGDPGGPQAECEPAMCPWSKEG